MTDREERRSAERFRVERDVVLFAESMNRGNKMHTRDISSAGAFLLSELSVPVGTPVRLKLTLLLNGGDRSVDAAIYGEVVRSEADGIAVHFAENHVTGSLRPQ